MESDTPAPRSIVFVAVLFEGALALIALVAGWLLLDRPPLAQIEWTWSAVAYGLAATAPLVAGLYLITAHPIGPFKRLTELVEQSIVPIFRSSSLWELLIIAALAGLGEELLFRGVVQAAIQQYFSSPWLAIAVAAALFGLAHPITTTYAVLAAAIGVYLGWLQLTTDNLLTPIITHATYDFAALLYLIKTKGSKTKGSGVLFKQ